MTAVAHEESRGAGGQATTLEVRGGQATRRGASCYTQQRTCEKLLYAVVLFFVWVSIVLLGSGSAESDPVINCQLARR